MNLQDFFNWLKTNPGATASLASALVAASVALIVFALTQFIVRRREQTRLLTSKLEELYLVLNQVAEDNAKFCKLVLLSVSGDKGAMQQTIATDDSEIYGHRSAQRIIMYIRLYFPQLSRIHQLLFSAQSRLNILIFALHTQAPPSFEEVLAAGGYVGHFIRLMEQEIISNRDALLKDGYLRRYKYTTQQQIDAEIPPPPDPVFAPPPL
jgi:hypothetical protein